MVIYAFHPVMRCRRKGLCCDILEHPPCYMPGPHYGQRSYYVITEDGMACGAFWSELEALSVAKALLRHKDRRRSVPHVRRPVNI